MTATKQEAMPEAISSVTFTLESSEGYPLLFTVRGASGMELLTAMKTTIEPKLKELGYKPQVKQYGPGRPKKEVEIVPDRKCPKCGASVVRDVTKDGRKFVKCSTQKYDFTTKQRSGCDYFSWEDTDTNKQVSNF
jgi:hypothetical protein